MFRITLQYQQPGNNQWIPKEIELIRIPIIGDVIGTNTGINKQQEVDYFLVKSVALIDATEGYAATVWTTRVNLISDGTFEESEK